MIAPPAKLIWAYYSAVQSNGHFVDWSKATVIFWISVAKSNTGNINVTGIGVTQGKLKRDREITHRRAPPAGL
jgi:hypothetical protein